MKLATYRDGSRDGQLVVVSRDLSQAHFAAGIASRLQSALDDWNFLAPQLEELSTSLNHGRARHAFAYEPQRCLAPLPRAYQRADASAYPSHLARLRQARGAGKQADSPWPLVMYQGGSDDLLGPCEDACFGSPEDGIDFEAEIAAITGDVAQGASPEQALEGVRLLMLANDWTLRNLVPEELAKGFGLIQSKPSTSFSPVAVTPDELGLDWSGGRVHLAIQSSVNGQRSGEPDAGAEMHFHFGELIAHLAHSRRVRAGSIVGAGAVSNADRSRGFSCLAEQRADDGLAGGAAQTGYLRFGDVVQIEMRGRDGVSLFGAIRQRVSDVADTEVPVA